jgi:hypothetical protein
MRLLADANDELAWGDSNITSLVFVQMRQTAAVLSHVLGKAGQLRVSIDPDDPGKNLEFLSTDFAVGQANRQCLKTNPCTCVKKCVI